MTNKRMTVKEFLDAGFKFVEGDQYSEMNGKITIVGDSQDVNDITSGDGERHVIKAKCLDTHDQIIDSLLNAELSTETFTVKMPKTKTEYVKVEDSIFDLKSDFEAGRLYRTSGDGHEVVSGERDLFQWVGVGNFLYRKVEKTITEREAFIESLKTTMKPDENKVIDMNWGEFGGKLFDSGKFKLVD